MAQVIARTPAELNQLSLNAVILTPDHLAWQAHDSVNGVLNWHNCIDGMLYDMTSTELVQRTFQVIKDQDPEFVILYQGDLD